MGHTRAITVSVMVIVILIAIGYAMHLDEERGKMNSFSIGVPAPL